MEITAPFRKDVLRARMQDIFEGRNRDAPPSVRDDPGTRERLISMMAELGQKIMKMIQEFFRKLASFFHRGQYQEESRPLDADGLAEPTQQELKIMDDAVASAADFSPESGFRDLPDEEARTLIGVKLGQLAAEQAQSRKHTESLEDALYKRLKAACTVAGIKLAPEQLFDMVQTPFHQDMPGFLEVLGKYDEGLSEAVQALEYARAEHQVSQIALSEFGRYAHENGLSESDIENTLSTYGISRSAVFAVEEGHQEDADRESFEEQGNVIRFPGSSDRPSV